MASVSGCSEGVAIASVHTTLPLRSTGSSLVVACSADRHRSARRYGGDGDVVGGDVGVDGAVVGTEVKL